MAQKQNPSTSSVLSTSPKSLEAFDQFLEDMGKYDLLTRAEERELSRRIQEGEQHMKKVYNLRKEIQATLREVDPARLRTWRTMAVRPDAIESMVVDIEECDEHCEEIARILEENATVLADAKEALDVLVQHNLRLVAHVARDQITTGVPFGDAVMEGVGGLMDAARRFDWRRDVPFGYYAPQWIEAAIRSFVIRHRGPTKVPDYRGKDMGTVSRSRTRLREELGRTPSAQEIARDTGETVETVELILGILSPDVRLDAPVSEDDDSTEQSRYFGESRDEAISREEGTLQDIAFKYRVREAMRVLGDREQKILTLNFGLDGEREHTLAEIGEIFGVTPERIRQIRKKAFGKMRQSDAFENFEGF